MKNGELSHVDLHLGRGVSEARGRSISSVTRAKPLEDVGREGLGKRPQREDLRPKS